MARKTIPPAIEQTVLIKSRRRCCLCHWLEGETDVKKGQIAHLDSDPSNNDEDNLCFLCLGHHDEYDTIPRQSKGLKLKEVKAYRDELYKEMESQFAALKKKSMSLRVEHFLFHVQEGNDVVEQVFSMRFRLTNNGDTTLRTPIVSIGLINGIEAKEERYMSLGPMGRVPMPDLGGFEEVTEDFFEANGRIAQIEPIRGMNPVLMQGHHVSFDGLAMSFRDFPPGTEITLPYRLDAEDMQPVFGELQGKVPDDAKEFIFEED